MEDNQNISKEAKSGFPKICIFLAWLQKLLNLILKFSAKESIISTARALEHLLIHPYEANHWKKNDTGSHFPTCFQNSFSFISKVLTAPCCCAIQTFKTSLFFEHLKIFSYASNVD
jgi:hypothetical protein